jgi:hypothetical protein
MDQKLISMTEKELFKFETIKDVISGKINGTDASKLLTLTIRHIKRLKSLVVKLGAKGLAHKNRGKSSNRKTADDVLEKAKTQIKEKYYDFGPTFASEKLKENDDIELSKETTRQIMIELGLWKIKPRKQPKKRHAWRARKDNYGEMGQFDGSYHEWFGSEESCLLLAIDDATGKLTHAKFDYNESTVAVFKFWLEYFEKNGLPLSIYLDKFSTYKINHKKAVDNPELITQFKRAMNQVGVETITAHSPEAKGRVERMFETLQDRLVKELRLANITDIAKANKFLETYIPKFNAKFSVLPNRKNDLHKKTSQETKNKLPQIFSIQEDRKVNNDYTIMFKNQYFQLEQKQPTTVYKKDTVVIEKHLSGEIKIRIRNFYLKYQVLPIRPKKIIDLKLPAITPTKQTTYKPPIDHPWRRSFICSKVSIVEAKECVFK